MQSSCDEPAPGVDRPSREPKLTQRSVARTLFFMALPMLGGTFAMNAFNLTDTWFVAQLGNQTGSVLPLAAMGFSFPVVMFLLCIVRGVGMGATSVIAKTLGEGNHEEAKRLTTHAMMLAVLVVMLFSVAGVLTINPLFEMLGAGDEVLPLIRTYMTVWYLGVVFMVVPMVAEDIIRATGDTVRPSMIMFGGSVLNMILDPIMIFGKLGCPRLEIAGAALATVISRAAASVAVLWVLTHCHDLVYFHIPGWKRVKQSWASILHIGLPASFSNLLMPISGGVITRIVAHFGGVPAVAACAAGSRLEMLAFMVPMCLGMSLVPFVGQNFGAGRLDRVHQGARMSMTFASLFGLAAFVAFFLLAPYMAGFFVEDPEGHRILVLYLRIVSFGYGLMEVHRYSGFLLNGIHKPLHATGVNVLRVVVLLIPLALIGGHLFGGVVGVFWGRLAADVTSGLLGALWYRRVMRRVEKERLLLS